MQTLEKGYEITEWKREKGEDVVKERVGKGLRKCLPCILSVLLLVLE